MNRRTERPQGSQTDLESWHCLGGDASVGLTLGLKGWVGSKERKPGGGGYFSVSRSAGLESEEAGRGESRDWWEEKVYKKLFLVVKVKNQGLQRSLHTERNKRPRVKTSIQNQT